MPKTRSLPEDSYYSKVVVNGETIIDLTADTVDAAHMLTGYTVHDNKVAPITGTCNFDANTLCWKMSAAGVLAGKTAYSKGSKVAGSMPSNGGGEGTISGRDTPYTMPQGYHDGSGTVEIDAAEKSKIVADNIRQGVTILGVEGTMAGTESVNAQSKSVKPTFSEQQVIPDSPTYNYLSQVTVQAIPVSEAVNEQGGYTLTVG